MNGDQAEAAAWHDWQHAIRQRVIEAETVREAIRDAHEEEERLARIEARRDPDFEGFRTAMTGEPPRTIASVLADLAAIPDRWWDPEAPEGSAANPVRLDAPQPAAQRSQRASDVQRLLDRAAAADREFARHEAAWHEREIARRRPAGYGEIVRLDVRGQKLRAECSQSPARHRARRALLSAGAAPEREDPRFPSGPGVFTLNPPRGCRPGPRCVWLRSPRCFTPYRPARTRQVFPVHSRPLPRAVARTRDCVRPVVR